MVFDVMLSFRVIAFHLLVASIRLGSALVPTGFAVVLFTSVPVSETRSILLPVTEAIIGFMGWALPWVVACTYPLYPFFGYLWHQIKVGL